MKYKDRCPEKEILEKFLDYDLSEEMTKKIFSHLQLCDNCKHTVRCLLSDEKKLLHSLFKEPVSYKSKGVSSTEKCFSKAAILAYAKECLNENQLKLVESHLEKCDNCLNELINLQRSMALQPDLELDISALKQEQTDVAEPKTDVLTIILKLKDNIFELIRHTGELLSLTPQYDVVRGKEIKAEDSIVIRKDFKDKDLSIEITMNKELVDYENNVKISLMKLSTEEFVPGVSVSITGKNIHQQGKTDDNGIIEFYCHIKGKYDISITGNKISSITIQ
jgi:hypothetical protein